MNHLLRMTLAVLAGGLLWQGVSCAEEVRPAAMKEIPQQSPSLAGEGLQPLKTGIALEEGTGRYATVIEVRGNAQVQMGDSRQPLKVGMVLQEGSSIETTQDSSVVVFLDGDGKRGRFELEEGAQLSLETLRVDAVSGDEAAALNLAVGCVLVEVETKLKGGSKFQVKTPVATTGVRGTAWETCFADGTAMVSVLRGTVWMQEPGKPETRVDLPEGTQRSVRRRGEDEERPIPPRERGGLGEKLERLRQIGSGGVHAMRGGEIGSSWRPNSGGGGIISLPNSRTPVGGPPRGRLRTPEDNPPLPEEPPPPSSGDPSALSLGESPSSTADISHPENSKPVNPSISTDLESGTELGSEWEEWEKPEIEKRESESEPAPEPEPEPEPPPEPEPKQEPEPEPKSDPGLQ